MAIELYDLPSKVTASGWPPFRSLTPHPFRMPGGEWHISGDRLDRKQIAYVRGASADDLVALAIWADAVHRDGGKPSAIIPYLPGARQDRWHPGEALSAGVYANIINSMKLRRVVCLDPHSDVMPALLNNVTVVPAAEVIRSALGGNNNEHIDGVVIPDAGAFKRATAIAEVLEVPCYQGFKHRDRTTGKLSGFSCETVPSKGRLLVVDDICDGGGTFKGLAAAMFTEDRAPIPKERLALYVTHGVFSKGAETLGKVFSAIYTTDSHPGSPHAPLHHCLPVFEILSRYLHPHI